MKKILAKILLILFAAFSFNSVFSSSINFDFEWKSKIKSVSIAEKSWTMEQAINTIWFNALTTFKVIIWWLLVIYMVYAWVMMIISLWSDEEKLSSSKRSLWYSIIWLLFVNIPWTLYNAFTWKATTDNVTWNFWNVKTIYNRNIFMNTQAFWNVVWTILDFLQISIVALAVFMVVLQWVKIMKAMWKDEDVTEAKNKIIGLNLNPVIYGSGETVIAQIPEVSTKMQKGGRIILYTDKEVDKQKVVVPNLVGLTLANANKTALDAGLNMNIKGASGVDVVSVSQSIPACEKVDKGSVIKVEFTSKGSTDNVQ